ncbi:MAG: restriction endonuclease [Pyrinomonadaceae bacterium]|nr:restriction endonuclease [Pyrinomonadaceae bacterium]
MRIVEVYSHLNGLEHIKVHKRGMWRDILQVISSVDAATCRTKLSKEKTKVGRTLFSPIDMNVQFAVALKKHGWAESRTSYWVTSDHKLIRKTMHMSAAEQRQEIIDAGKVPIFSYNQTDFVKDRIAIEVQLGKYSFVAYDLFVKHMAFFVGDVIDVGIEILPMKELQAEMSSGVGYYESELYNLMRQGRGVPAVPLVVIGIGC